MENYPKLCLKCHGALIWQVVVTKRLNKGKPENKLARHEG